ncbi:hypothetical protein [Janthinobacterium sp. PC23-8]|uniref:hypothetical protein n=1 Tax=Janthinobacterium sp. PC23-8 TaxID=2012679 RepID=UPI0011400E95|nr:hypothetical protein [Janthinobacterium sp. PC23-8]
MGWFVASILIPLIAPVLGMLVLQRLPLPVSESEKHLLAPVKDGQLCWGSLAFCALAMYEIAVPGTEGPLVSGNTVHWLNGGFVFLLAASAVIAAGGAVFPTKIKAVRWNSWHKHYQALATSLVLTLLSGAAYSVLHYGLLKS